jgi:hypothetical protein
MNIFSSRACVAICFIVPLAFRAAPAVNAADRPVDIEIFVLGNQVPINAVNNAPGVVIMLISAVGNFLYDAVDTMFEALGAFVSRDLW